MTHSLHAPAKINLWLRIFAPDHTGYHPLDTLFCAITLADRLDISLSGDVIRLDVRGPDLGPVAANLAFRAAQEYFLALNEKPGVHITLHKHIPARAGLGGGSSDAAAVLRALQQLHEHRLPDADLMAIAARLGSDVPFFLCGSPLAQAGGRGELLQPRPTLPQRDVLVLVPDFPIPTKAAYDWLDQFGGLQQPDTPLDPTASWTDLHKVARNDFEPVLFQRYPVLQHLRDALLGAGASMAMVSGSGSAVFGIFEDAVLSARAHAALEKALPSTRILPAYTMTSELT